MTKTEYLYGKDFNPDFIKQQKNICEYKLHKIAELLSELQSVDMQDRDDKRINKVLKAREWNEELLREAREMLK